MVKRLLQCLFFYFIYLSLAGVRQSLVDENQYVRTPSPYGLTASDVNVTHGTTERRVPRSNTCRF